METEEFKNQYRNEKLTALDPENHPILGRFLNVLEASRREAVLDFMRRDLRARFEIPFRLTFMAEQLREELDLTTEPKLRFEEPGEVTVSGHEIFDEVIAALAGDHGDSVLFESWVCLCCAAERFGAMEPDEGKRRLEESRNPGETMIIRTRAEEPQPVS